VQSRIRYRDLSSQEARVGPKTFSTGVQVEYKLWKNAKYKQKTD